MKKLLLTSLAILILLTPSAQARSPRPGTGKKVVLIVANGLGAADLVDSELPGIRAALQKTAAVGLMNVRAAKGTNDAASAYLSLGTGARADAGSAGNLALNSGERFYLSGRPQKAWPVGQGKIISPSYPEMARLAMRLPYEARPGALGQALKQAGIKTEVHGNADSLGVYHREINLITMDGKGITDAGNVARPINTAAAALRLIDESTSARFIAFEFSVFSGIGLNRNFTSDQALAAEKKRALAELDSLFTRLAEPGATGRDTLTILVSPFPEPTQAKGGIFQTPVLVAGPGYSGVLSSPSTRWRGVVTNADVAPTILGFLGIVSPAELAGRPMTSSPAPDPLADIGALNEQATANYGARSVLLTSYISLIVAAIIGTALVLILWPGSKANVYLQPLLLVVLCFPAAALLANLFISKFVWLPMVLVPTFTLVFAVLIWLVWKKEATNAIAMPSLLATVVIVAQLAAGSALERNSVMGMSSIVGARFYGIGNEYMGVLIAASVIYLALLATGRAPLKELLTILVPAFFALLVVIVALPDMGANVGGGLAAVATSIVGFHLLRGGRLKFRHLVFVIAAMVVVIGGILMVDSLSSSASHVGRAAAAIGSGGSTEALDIIARKIATNFMLVTHSSWTNILLAALFAIVVLKLGAPEALLDTRKRYPVIVAACKTVAVGSLAAFLLNDSGVVAAALMVTFAACSWLYLLVEE